MILFVLLAVAVVLLYGLEANRRAAAMARSIEELRRRLDDVDRRSRAVDARVAEPPAAREIAARIEPHADVFAPREAPAGMVPTIAPAPAGEAAASAGAPAEERPPFAPAPERTATGPAEPASTSAPRRHRDVEALVGGVWLQNAGAVLLLVGFFFLILWGYATGRFGPGVLVAAGVLAGLGLVWRGTRMRRSVRGVGHALIGVGAGVVWLSIHLGHFRLGVLPAPAAFALVVLASGLTAALGLRFRAQDIAALGVIGAHLPIVLGLSDRSALPPGALLGYLAGLNALVFLLAARAGWSALALGSLLLTAWSWIAGIPVARWSWPVEIGLAGLFAALGLAPLPRLARIEGTVRPVDLAVIAVAPLALLAASAPMFQIADARYVAILMLGLATLYMGAAWWVDTRRPERDLWRPLTAAAVLLLTIAIERATGPNRTPLAWTLEGVALVLLGLGTRGGWLRVCGYVVLSLGAMGMTMGAMGAWTVRALPVMNPPAITTGLGIAALLFGAHRMRRERARLGALERVVVAAWLAGAHVMLMGWFSREAFLLAWAFEGDGGPLRAMRDVRAPHGEARLWGLMVPVTVLAWLAQAAWLVRSGLRGGGLLARGGGTLIAGLAAASALGAALLADSWGRDLPPLVHREALLALAAIVLVIVAAASLARSRPALSPFERRTPELWAALAALLLMVWIAREADHVARIMLDAQGPLISDRGQRIHTRSLAGMLTSVGWLAEALVAFVLGWSRRSAFLRWTGLALIGVTVLKFLLVDLSGADPFWRFLTAIGAGAAMLVLSYVYQRAGTARRAAPAAEDR
jgi:uncharacterized membrane protein